MVTSRADRSTLPRSSPAAPSRQTQTPLMATASCSGSKAASVVPTAASTRPQFGSSPWIAHLSRLLRATARPTVDGVVARRRAGRPRPRCSCVAPSASSTSCRARSAQTVCDGGEQLVVGRRGARTRRRRAAARCRWWTCSRRSRPGRRSSRWPRRSTRVQPVRLDDGVGGEDDEHRREPGREHAGALGHPADDEARADRDGLLGDRVGGHDGPRRVVGARHGEQRYGGVDAGQQPVHRQPLADQPGRADRDVDRPRRRAPSATYSAVAWVSWKPAGPVQALAPPELRTTASTRPSAHHLLRPHAPARP